MESQFKAGCFQIIVDLGAMPIRQFTYGFDSNNDLVVTNQIRFVGLAQDFIFFCVFCVFRGL